MQLSQIALLALKGTEASVKQKFADEFNVSIASIYLWISENRSNGPLTRTRAVQMISEETGLEPNKILEDQKEPQNT